MSFVENPNLYGYLKVRVTGRETFGDHPIQMTGNQNFDGQASLVFSSTTSYSIDDLRLYDESDTVTPVPDRVNYGSASFPAASVGPNLGTVQLEITVPFESTGGEPYIEAYLGETELGSYREQRNVVVLRQGDDVAWDAFQEIFGTAAPFTIEIASFEDFGAGQEPVPVQLTTGTVRVRAWID